MVIVSRCATINGTANIGKALEWGKGIAHYLEGKFGFSNMRVGIEVYGTSGRMYWISEQESLESFARNLQEATRSSEYMQKLSEGAGLFVPGSVKDTVIQLI